MLKVIQCNERRDRTLGLFFYKMQTENDCRQLIFSSKYSFRSQQPYSIHEKYSHLLLYLHSVLASILLDLLQ